jgi:hypothetical protein
MRSAGAILSVVPVLKLAVGTGNIFEQRPVRVTSQSGLDVTVECAGGDVVHLDFKELTARKTSTEGEFLYRGGIEDGNAGLGFLSAR